MSIIVCGNNYDPEVLDRLSVAKILDSERHRPLLSLECYWQGSYQPGY